MRYTHSVTFAANVNQISVNFASNSAGTAGADDSLQITGIQLEVGDTATDFEHEDTGTTLRNCHRYYQLINVPQGYYNTLQSTAVYHSLQYPTIMRAAANATEHTTIRYFNSGSAANFSPTSITGYSDRVLIQRPSGLTNFNGMIDGKINLDSEL